MEGILQIFYKDGETRNIQLQKEFFTEDKKQGHTISSKAYNLALSFNPEPWKIHVTREGDVVYNRVLPENTPDHILEAQADKELNSAEIKKAA